MMNAAFHTVNSLDYKLFIYLIRKLQLQEVVQSISNVYTDNNDRYFGIELVLFEDFSCKADLSYRICAVHQQWLFERT